MGKSPADSVAQGRVRARAANFVPETVHVRASAAGVQGLHRLGPLGHGGSGSVPSRPPQCCSHLRSASKVPEEPAAVLSHPEQGEPSCCKRLFFQPASTRTLYTHPSCFHVRVRVCASPPQANSCKDFLSKIFQDMTLRKLPPAPNRGTQLIYVAGG